MQRNIFITLILVLVAGSNVHAEALFGPSKSELASQKLIVENRNELIALKQRVDELGERIDGLTTLIEGLNTSINTLQRLQNSQPAQVAPAASYPMPVEPKADQISRGMVSNSSDLYQNSSSGKTSYGATSLESPAASQSQSGERSDTASLDSESSSSLYSEGVRLFQKQEYSESQKRFMMTQDKNYKPAASNYYLGEIAYYTKKYSDAIFYFKKSAGIQDQASYIDTLLLHTAISLEKTGDTAQAKTFYQSIIDGYPEKKSAEIAKKNINKL